MDIFNNKQDKMQLLAKFKKSSVHGVQRHSDLKFFDNLRWL